MIDWTISIGNLLTLGAFAASGVGFVVAVRRDVAVLSNRLFPIESAVNRLADILEKLGRQDERLKAVERDIERNGTRQQRRKSGSRWVNPSHAE